MFPDLPILQVLIPLLAAPACALLRRGHQAWALALAASAAAFGVSVALLSRVLSTGTMSYAIGGWAPPWGIEYRVDAVCALVLVVVAGVGLAVMAFARGSVEAEVPAERHPLLYTAYLLCLSGQLGIVSSGDAFNVFVFLEISSLATYTLISLGRDRRALTAAYQYLIMGTIGATFVLIGIGLLYVLTGTLNMVDLSQRVAELQQTRTVRAAFGFLTVGISLKLALFPLHLWLPNAYTYAPSAVTAFVAATSTKVAVYLFIRFFFSIFGGDFSFGEVRLAYILLPLALAGIVSASVVAIFQHDVKRMLAYSSVAQIGYMILGISFATVTGLAAGIIHLFNHALMKGALFLALGCIAYRLGRVELRELAGLGRLMPWTCAAFVAGGLSLVGVPLTVGFISKWYLVWGAIEIGWWPVAVVIVAGSLLALIYVWRVVEVAYFRPAGEGAPAPREAPLALLLPTWTLVGANLYFGADASLTTGVARQAARMLLGGGP